MSTNGSRIAISGSESQQGSDNMRGYVDIFDADKLLYTVYTESIEAVAPIVNVVISGDGKTLAVGSVFPTGGSAVSDVDVYDLTNKPVVCADRRDRRRSFV